MAVDAGKKSGVTSGAAKSCCNFCADGARPQTEEIVQFIDAHRALYGGEPICRVMKIAPSTYYRCKALEAESERRCQLFHQDEAIGFYSCPVARLMAVQVLCGICQGRGCVKTIPDDDADKPLDLVSRQFTAQRPN